MDPPGTVKVACCHTFKEWKHSVEDEGVIYLVEMTSTWDPRLRLDFEYKCTCSNFVEKNLLCVHVLIARGYHCAWHAMFDPEGQIENDVCPRCGEETMEITYAPD